MNKLFKTFTIIFFLILICVNIPKAQTDHDINGSSIKIDKTKIDFSDNNLEQKLNIENIGNNKISFDVNFTKYDKLEDEKSTVLDMSKFLSSDIKTIVLNPHEKKDITIILSKDINNYKQSFYSSLTISTNNVSKSQTILNHGYSIPIQKIYNDDLSSQKILLKNIDFGTSFLNIYGKGKVNFNIENTGNAIYRVLGDYTIINSNGDVVFTKALTNDNIVLYPGQVKGISDQVDFTPNFYDNYSLYINLYRDDGDKLIQNVSSILYIQILTVGITFISGILILVGIIYVLKKRPFVIDVNNIEINLKAISILIISLSIIFSSVTVSHAQAPGYLRSNNYIIDDSNFGMGTNSSSSNYNLKDGSSSIQGTSNSTNYNQNDGPVPLYFAYTPASPTLSNNSGLYYDRFKVVLNNTGFPTDSEFAVMCYSPSFSGYKYVTSANILASTSPSAILSPADNVTGWRKYNSGALNWGGSSGIEVTGLQPNTGYSCFAKARQKYGTNTQIGTESSKSVDANITTGSLSLAFQILGVTAGGINTITSQVNSVNFGSLTPGIPQTASNTMRVTTNAQGGYSVTMSANQRLQSGSNYIDWFTGNSATYSIPQLWLSPTGTNSNAGWIGFHLDDNDISQFQSGGTKYAPFPVYPTTNTVATTSAPQNNTQQDDNISYKIEVNTNQSTGTYSGMILTYLLSAVF